MYQIWKKNLHSFGRDRDIKIWPTFGHKVGHSNPIDTKRELDL